MKSLDDLKQGDYVAFEFKYNGDTPPEIIVDNIISVFEESVLVHFLYGHHSLSEFVKKSDIIAIGNKESGQGKIPHWSGNYDILKPEHPLLKK